MRSSNLLSLCSVVLALAATMLGGCYLEVGTTEDETEEVVDEPVVEVAPSCEIADCELFCWRGGQCGYEEGQEESCVPDCLEACDDGLYDDGDAAILTCVSESNPDAWCDGGLLESCCAELDAWSDFCE